MRWRRDRDLMNNRLDPSVAWFKQSFGHWRTYASACIRMSSKQCERCERFGTHENTIHSCKYPGDELPFHSLSVCVPCHNWSQREMRGKVQQLRKYLVVAGNRLLYIEQITEYENDYRLSSGQPDRFGVGRPVRGGQNYFVAGIK